MTATWPWGTALVRVVRRRVRLRTRLARAAGAWRRAFPRRLPGWSEPADPAVTRAGDETRLVVASPGSLAPSPGDAAGQLGRSLRLEVTDWRTPYPGWSGRLGPLPGLLRHAVALPESGRGPATVTVTVAGPVPVAHLVAAARQVLEPAHPLPRPASADPPPGRAAVVHDPVVFDATAANPRGRGRHRPGLPAGELSLVPHPAGGTGWEIARVTDGVTVVAGRAGDPLDRRRSGVLAGLGVVSFPGAASRAAALVLVQLAGTGVVLHASNLPADLVAPELTGLVRAPLPGRDADPLEWEIRSVAQRRAAIRHHAAGLAHPAGHPGLHRPPAVSALLVTRRPELVARAIGWLAAQTYPELEVVLGLHGVELPPGLELPGRLPTQVVRIPAGWSLGEALGEATRVARGSLVTKVDDDDRYGPEHVWDLVLARHYSNATVAGKGAEFVHVVPREVTVRRRMACEEFADGVAGGTILISRGDLEAVGGWPPVPRSVDRGLLDRVLAGGGLVYRTHPFGFIYCRHQDGHTWDPGPGYFIVDPLRTWQGLPRYGEFGT